MNTNSKGINGYQKSLHPCALDERSLSIGGWETNSLAISTEQVSFRQKIFLHRTCEFSKNMHIIEELWVELQSTFLTKILSEECSGHREIPKIIALLNITG